MASVEKRLSDLESLVGQREKRIVFVERGLDGQYFIGNKVPISEEELDEMCSEDTFLLIFDCFWPEKSRTND